jgi:hypothetical protein
MTATAGNQRKESMSTPSPVLTITLDDITKQVCAIKPVSRRQLMRYMRKCKIKRAGKIHQKPERYPADSGERILAQLGLRIIGLPELRDERRRAKLNRNGRAQRRAA